MENDHWERRASCASRNRTSQTKDLDWFSNVPDEKYEARAICQGQCPVRKDCINAALERKELWGIWGGVDEYEIRRALSVDANGDPLVRDRPPRCPYCMSKKLDIAGQKNKHGYKTSCNECETTWYMATIPQRFKNGKNKVA
jgi:hypothetical protein